MSTHAALPSRRHDIDALRVLAFGLLILYHVAMFYVADWGWHVKSAYLSETLQLPMMLVNQWRMPLIFLLSGVAISFVVGKYRRGELAWRRISRLLLPLAFGMAVVIPPQAYYQALANGAIEPGYGQFLWRYFSFQGWPPGAFDGSDIGITWNHLWYLPYLLAYTLVLIALLPLLRGPGARLVTRARSLRGIWLIVLPTLPLMLYGLTLFPLFGGVSHNFYSDGYAHALYFSFFFYGFVLGKDPGIWAEIARLRWVTLVLGVISFVSFMGINAILPDSPSPAQSALQLVVIYLNRWIWLLLVLGWAHHALNRPFRWLPQANRAVYPWYVLHQSITVVVGYELGRLSLGPVIELTLVLGLTVLGCALGYALIARVRWLQPLFGVDAVPTAPDRDGRDASSAREALPAG